MPSSSFGPIAEIRNSFSSPAALAVGSAIGGAAPLVNYSTVHYGRLIWFEQNVLHFAGWSPLWILVAGSFGLSSKSVFLWGRNTFGDAWSAAALVAMLEGTLLLAPLEEMKVSALVFLVLLNAAAYGSTLARRDKEDRARDAAKSAVGQQGVEELEGVSLLNAERAQVGATEPDSAKVVPVDLYNRAIEVARKSPSLSAESLRRSLKVRQPAAAALLAQLANDGVVGDVDPADRMRRPVLLRADNA